MKMLCISRLLATLALVAGLGTAGSLAAQEQFRAPTWGRVSGSAGLRYGTENLALGLGARAGFTIEPGVYIGGMFDYFLGDSEEAGQSSYSYSFWMLMAEAGYDFGVVDNLVIRPKAMLGVVGVSSESCIDGLGCDSGGDSELRLGLGGEALYFFTPSVAAGGELRLMFLGETVLVLGAHIGMMI